MSSSEVDRKVALIRRLVEARRGEELRHMLLGASAYCSSSNDRRVRYPPRFAEREDGFHLMTWVQAHLEFTAAYGTERQQVEQGGRIHFAHREEYELWLSEGSPGLFLEELEAYVANEPLGA
jgi:hypothetical protein